jgi:hypothetical protein
MKYLKLYEELKNEISLEDFDNTKYWYYGTKNWEFLFKLIDIDVSPLKITNPNKVYHYQVYRTDGIILDAFYDTKDLKILIDEMSESKIILHPATEEEIEKFEMICNVKKYNI